MKDKKKQDSRSGSLKVDPSVLKEVKDYCKKNGVFLTYFGTEALREKLKASK